MDNKPQALSPKMSFVFGIVSAIALISVVGFFTLLLRGDSGSDKNVDDRPSADAGANQGDDIAPADVKIKEITKDDHIRGSFDAPVKIVEYSDLECPFCKKHHTVMQQIVDEYGEDKVAWVYKHFPLVSLHSKAPKEAEATECAAELGGNDGFWALTDKIFEVTPTNNGLDLETLPDLAAEVGLNKDDFKECLDSGKYAEKVQAEYEEAVAAGGQGTPYNVVVGPDGTTVPLAGAYPIEAFKEVIDSMLE